MDRSISLFLNVTPKPSRKASQNERKGREPLMAASQLGNARTGGTLNTRKRPFSVRDTFRVIQEGSLFKQVRECLGAFHQALAQVPIIGYFTETRLDLGHIKRPGHTSQDFNFIWILPQPCERDRMSQEGDSTGADSC